MHCCYITATNSTSHYEKRKNQRGFSKEQINQIITYGEIYHVGNSCIAYWLNRRANNQYRSQDSGHDLPYNSAVIVSYDNKIVTVMHCNNKPGHWRAA